MNKDKVYANIEESIYYYDYFGIRLYFSSKIYLQKYKDRVDNYMREEKIKIKNKYKINGVSNHFLLIAFYMKIETRGFRVYLIEDGQPGRRLYKKDVLIE